MKIKNINVHFTEAEIDKKIRELGARISEDYAGIRMPDLYFKGSIFLYL